LKAIVHGTDKDEFWLQVRSAMQQAALDMGVMLELELRKETDSAQMSQEIMEAARNPSKNYAALIVTIPDEIVQTAVSFAIDKGVPVFGFNLGYEVAGEIGVLGFAAQDDYVAGVAAAEEFLRITNITKAVFINNKEGNTGLEARFQGFQDTLSTAKNSTIEVVEQVIVDPENMYEHVNKINDRFEGCPYDAVLLGGVASLDVAIAAMEKNKCAEISTIGSFDETADLLKNIVNEKIAFGVSQQHYLQSILPVYFAAIYATTGKALALPKEDRVYLSGPNIINKDTLPTDTQEQCAADGFPVCPNELAPSGEAALCSCTERQQIRIGGVLHGVTTDSFWDPVFVSAEQAAADMNVNLDLIRFEPQEDPQEVYLQMAARIRSLCESGVDGIFVTIPSDTVVDSIKRCQELKVPVTSVNSGGDISVELGILNHIGMLEYSAGFGAGERLIEAGMMRGYCLNHEPGNLSVEQRCQGFGDAIVMHGQGVSYQGEFAVPLDNKAKYLLDVESAVGKGGDWKGEGFLMAGTIQIAPYREGVRGAHPSAVVGSFDVSASLYEGLVDGTLLFGIDQQPYLQGNMPVYLLTLVAYTKQFLKNHFIESGPSFVISPPSNEAKVCEANFFEVCPDRPEEDMSLISPGLLYLGYTLFAIMSIGAIACLRWTMFYRNKWVVKISQPLFLYMILFGTIVSSLSIPFLGVETGYRYEQDEATGQLTDVENPDIDKVDAACMALPWLYGLGFAISFSAIFAKIQRVKLIYIAGINMQRKKVEIKDVLTIMVVILGIELGILVSWQIASPHQWERTITDETDGFPVESFGRCKSELGHFFWIGIVLFHAICLIYALVLSFQTKNINSEFAESSYLFLAVMFMFQVSFCGSWIPSG
jgi:simple sugar transport system substrate-binding protein